MPSPSQASCCSSDIGDQGEVDHGRVRQVSSSTDATGTLARPSLFELSRSERDHQEKLCTKMTTMLVTASMALFAGGVAQAMPVASLAKSDASLTLVLRPTVA